MSDELDLHDDDEEQTLRLDENDEEGLDISLDDGGDDLAIVDDDVPGDDDAGAEEEDEILEIDEDEPLPPPSYRPESNVYALFLVISLLAYLGAIAITLAELYEYTDPQQFLWGLFDKGS